MSVTAKDFFDSAIKRADRFLFLYDILHDTRQRRSRGTWDDDFKSLVKWSKSSEVIRIDGRDKKSILVLKKEIGIDREHFTHDYISELLRSAVVTTVSALDRYIHQLILNNIWRLLSQSEENIPTKLREFKIPILATKRALEKLRSDKKTRPGHLIKAEIQETLYRDTFQNVADLDRAAGLLGIGKFWVKLAKEFPNQPKASDIQGELKLMTNRRNQIVHESDLTRKRKAQGITLRDITRKDAELFVEWMKKFVVSIDKVVKAEKLCD